METNIGGKEPGKENRPGRWFYRPACWILGHEFLPAKDKPKGWFNTHCNRCGFNWTKQGRLRGLARYRTGQGLVWLANKIQTNDPSEGWQMVNNIEYISRSHLQSYVDQGSDQLISEYLHPDPKNIIHITDENAEEMAELINKSLTYQATKQEQEELNK